MNIPWLAPHDALPDPESAQSKQSPIKGLVAAGDDLSTQRLLEAYKNGIFPWFSKGQPILWWSPDPRMVLQCSEFRLHRSFCKTLLRFIDSEGCEIRIDHDFGTVIKHCAQTTRKGQQGTWIVEGMIQAYTALHEQGFAHSVETWREGQLVGGLYCVSIGDTVFGESMFALETDASKIALAGLVAFALNNNLRWIDCQQNTQHLYSLGARELPRSEFLQHVRQARKDTLRDWVFSKTYWHSLFPGKVFT